jgi:hypothetical protein
VLVLEDVGEFVDQGGAHCRGQSLAADCDSLVLERVVGQDFPAIEVLHGVEEVNVSGDQAQGTHQAGEVLQVGLVLCGELVLVRGDGLLELGRR